MKFVRWGVYIRLKVETIAHHIAVFIARYVNHFRSFHCGLARNSIVQWFEELSKSFHPCVSFDSGQIRPLVVPIHVLINFNVLFELIRPGWPLLLKVKRCLIKVHVSSFWFAYFLSIFASRRTKCLILQAEIITYFGRTNNWIYKQIIFWGWILFDRTLFWSPFCHL